MPAAAVIPAPIVYIKVAAVKKLVVGFRNRKDLRSVERRVPDLCFLSSGQPSVFRSALASFLFSKRGSGLGVGQTGIDQRGSGSFTLKKLECSKQA